jgi:hypothetical protein
VGVLNRKAELENKGKQAMSNTINLADFEELGADSAASMHLRKIVQADKDGAADARCSTTEAIMVALALCNRAYLPEGLNHVHAGHLWWRLDDAQRSAIQMYGQTLSKGGYEASADRRC